MIAEKAFLIPASISRIFPNFRGKVRAFLAYYKALGLHDTHVYVETKLKKPVEFSIGLDLRCHHERMAFLLNGHEPDTTKFLVQLYDGEGAFLDIGANIGLISIPFALIVSNSGELNYVNENQTFVYSIEAIKANLVSLKSNCERNNLGEKVIIVPHGVGNEEKTVDIQIERDLKDGEGTGTANILSATTDQQYERVPLELTTLDLLRNRRQLPEKISLIKIDLDGYDLFAMQGASRLLKECRPVVFGEFNAHCMNWHGQTITDVELFMAELGYETFCRAGSEWRFTAKFDAETYRTDCLLVPSEKVMNLEWCLAGSN